MFRKHFDSWPKPVLAEYSSVSPQNDGIRVVEQGSPDTGVIGQQTLSQQDSGRNEVLTRLPDKPLSLSESELSG